jgi:uncharacterized membrane protein
MTVDIPVVVGSTTPGSMYSLFRSALLGDATALTILAITLVVIVAGVIVLFRILGPPQHLQRKD